MHSQKSSTSHTRRRCARASRHAPALTDFLKRPLTPTQDVFKYGRIVASHKAAISELFQQLDGESKGSVAKGVLKDLVAKYQGKEFDEKKFYSWYDVHGRSTEKGPGGSIDPREFVSGLRIKRTKLCPGGCGLTLRLLARAHTGALPCRVGSGLRW